MLKRFIEFGKVEISKSEYVELLKQSERLEALKRYVAVNTYLDEKDVMAILGVETKENKND